MAPIGHWTPPGSDGKMRAYMQNTRTISFRSFYNNLKEKVI